MTFGIVEGLSLLGTVGKILNPQTTTTQATQSTSLDKSDFMEMFQEAMEKYDKGNSVDEETAKDKLEMLFSYLDSNQDGSLSKGEFANLTSMITSGKLKV